MIDLQLPLAMPTLRGDADRLTQVLLNLLSNAAKFLPPVGGRIVLRLLQREHLRLALLDVSLSPAP